MITIIIAYLTFTICPVIINAYNNTESDINENILIIIQTSNEYKISSVKELNLNNQALDNTSNSFESFHRFDTVDHEILHKVGFDMENNLMFWEKRIKNNSEIKQFIESDIYNRLNDEVLINTGIQEIERVADLAYDWIHKLLYYSDHQSLKVMSTEIPFMEIEIQWRYVEIGITQLNVNPIAFFIAWVHENDQVWKADMDGNNQTVLYTITNRRSILGLTTDISTNSLVWCEIYDIVVFDYVQRTLVRHNLDVPEVTYFDYLFGEVYYGDKRAHNILFIKSLINGTQVKIQNDVKLYSVRILHTSRQPIIPNQCSNSSCEYFCIPIDNNNNKCLCPTRLGETLETFKGNCTEYFYRINSETSEGTSFFTSTSIAIIVIISIVSIIVITIMTGIIIALYKKGKQETEEDIELYGERKLNEYDVIDKDYEELKFKQVYDDNIEPERYTEIADNVDKVEIIEPKGYLEIVDIAEQRKYSEIVDYVEKGKPKGYLEIVDDVHQKRYSEIVDYVETVEPKDYVEIVEC